MVNCPACSQETPAGSRFCPACAAPLDSGSEAPTLASPDDDATPAAPASAPPASAAADDEPRFVPGTVLAGRYRIVGLLGRGGMGEVYRADDLKLGQSVALKFLPQGLEQDPDRLERFLGEVKVALKITHPNVCRVYDVGEVAGSHYLSMEYIDGEDLASLLRRIGRLPRDKAVQIARQLCAGLAAAHDKGILHRDLKPANVMLDGRGDVCITDFGLAGLAEGFTGAEIRAGTPAYMAPEQLAGREVTVRSDIYALGLVLYELFTGKRTFSAETVADLARLQESGPTSPSSHVDLLDPTVERIILRCLAADPADRPASVLKVALALPGADPLAAALAAGETPSPEMVAEAGDDAAIKPRVAVPVMVLTLLGLLAVAGIAGRYHLLGRTPMDLPPEVLVHRAGEIVERLGHADPPADRAWGFQFEWGMFRHLAKDPSPGRWDRLSTDRPPGVYFWYRQSPRPLLPRNTQSRVWFNDPPLRGTGMVNLFLDPQGRLFLLKAVPPHREDQAPSTPVLETDWAAAFEEAGLDLESFTPVPPRWLPEAYCDQRAAWTGTYPDQGEPELRVEACSYRGKPVYFDVIRPWDRAFRQEERPRTAFQKVQNAVGGVFVAGLALGAVLLVRRNLKLGRGDRRGALRLALWVAGAKMAAWLFQASHAADLFDELSLFVLSMGDALFEGGLVWVLYMALEPFVRRRWPESLVSWNRLLAGRFRDPLVGRHLLYGAALGVGLGLLGQLGDIAPTWLGAAGATPPVTDPDTLLGTRWVLGEVFLALRHVAINPLVLLFILVLLRVLLRNSWIALGSFVVLMVFLGFPETDYVAIWIATQAVAVGAFGLFLMRFGLVSLVSAYFMANELLNNQPLTLDFSTWYAGSSLVALASGVALVLWAFRTALGGRPLWAGEG